ncbi:MAG TPA: alpha/beta hydrolase [Turneriella sp.]|nr:alpha/beta hydrolase [Turneriella sp.]
MPYFNDNDQSMYYRASGKGKDALLFIHGWYQNGAQAWSQQMGRFEKKYQVFIPDLLGHGMSALENPEAFSIATNRRILLAFIDYIKKKYKVRRVVLLGHSYGAFAALDLANEHTREIHGVVAMAAVDDYAPYVGELKKILRIPFFFGFLYYRIQALVGLFPYGDRPLLYNKNTPSLYPSRLAYAKIKNKTLSLKNSRAYMSAFVSAKIKWSEKKIPLPLFLIYGNRDALTPVKHAARIRPHFNNASLLLVEDAGHNVQISGAEKIEKPLLKFFEKCFRT